MNESDDRYVIPWNEVPAELVRFAWITSTMAPPPAEVERAEG